MSRRGTRHTDNLRALVPLPFATNSFINSHISFSIFFLIRRLFLFSSGAATVYAFNILLCVQWILYTRTGLPNPPLQHLESLKGNLVWSLVHHEVFILPYHMVELFMIKSRNWRRNCPKPSLQRLSLNPQLHLQILRRSHRKTKLRLRTTVSSLMSSRPSRYGNGRRTCSDGRNS